MSKQPTREARIEQDKRNATVVLGIYQRRFENGDRTALMDAVRTCAESGVLQPDWLATEIISAVTKARSYEIKSWDDVLGRPPSPKFNDHRDAERKQIHMMWMVWMRVEELSKAEKISGDDLFAAVGPEFGIGKKLCKK